MAQATEPVGLFSCLADGRLMPPDLEGGPPYNMLSLHQSSPDPDSSKCQEVNEFLSSVKCCISHFVTI
jgi:hypothetical protein